MIRELFDHGDEICGVVVNVRARQDKIALWIKNAANLSVQVSIEKHWKEFLDYKDTIGFIFHEKPCLCRKLLKRGDGSEKLAQLAIKINFRVFATEISTHCVKSFEEEFLMEKE